MSKLGKARSILCAVAMVFAASGSAFADGKHGSRREDAETARRGAESGEFVPLARIVAAVRERYPGEIVETEFESDGNRVYYEFHILRQDGHLIEIKVDARSGRQTGEEADDE